MRLALRFRSLLVVVLVLGACERALYYKPEGWPSHGAFEWIGLTPSFDIVTTGPGGTSNVPSAAFSLRVVNRGTVPVVFGGCVLETRRGPFPAVPGSSEEDLAGRTAPPAQTSVVLLLFEFKDAKFEVLGDAFDLVLNYRVGGGPNQRLKVHFVKR